MLLYHCTISTTFAKIISHKMKDVIIAPSMLACDFANLQKEIEMVNASDADWFHIDVMDGMFVPNISFGMPVMQAMKKHTKKPMDVHLMIEKPERYIQEFKDAGADILTVHYEASTHLHRTIQQIKAAGMKAGVSLNPHTSVYLLEDILADLDLVLLMSVNPGFGGQKFISNVFTKVEDLREMAEGSNPDLIIEIDGGVNSANAKELVDAGANALVAGSFVFKSDDPMQTIADLKQLK